MLFLDSWMNAEDEKVFEPIRFIQILSSSAVCKQKVFLSESQVVTIGRSQKAKHCKKKDKGKIIIKKRQDLYQGIIFSFSLRKGAEIKPHASHGTLCVFSFPLHLSLSLPSYIEEKTAI